MEKRMFFALALSLLVVMTFSYFNRPVTPPGADQKTETPAQQTDTEATSTEAGPKISAAEETADTSAEKPDLSTAEVTTKSETVPFSTPHVEGYFNRRGGELASARLLNYDLVETPESKYNLVSDTGGGLRLETGFPDLQLSNANYTQLESPDENTFIFQRKLENNLVLRKEYRLKPDRKYRFELSVKLINSGENSVELGDLDFPTGAQGQAGLGLRWGPGFGRARKEQSRFDKVYVYYGKDGGKEYFSTDGGGGLWGLFGGDEEESGYEFNRGPVDWIGVSNRYFISAIIPRQPFNMIYLDSQTQNKSGFTAWGAFGEMMLSAGESKTYDFELYMGPKKYYALQEVKDGLEATLNYGWFTILSLPLLKGLNYIYAAVPNYGIAIILLSIIIKFLLYPLTKKSLTSMQKMKELQPKIQELQDKYEDDKEKLNQKMMEFYQEENVNPLGGCLPMLLQLPIFISLYRTLQYSIELRGEPFFLWITDLSAKDPYYILPVLMGIIMFTQQWYTTASSGGEVMGQQKTMVYVMPVVFVFIFMRFPAGLVLYWMTNSGTTLLQYWLINRSMET